MQKIQKTSSHIVFSNEFLENDESDRLIHNLKSGTDKMAADFVNSFNSSIMTFILKISYS